VTTKEVGAYIAEERSVMGAVLANPFNYSIVGVMLARDLYHAEHASLWAAIGRVLDEPGIQAANAMKSAPELRAELMLSLYVDGVAPKRRALKAAIREALAAQQEGALKPRALKKAIEARNKRLESMSADDLAAALSDLNPVIVGRLRELGEHEALTKKELIKRGTKVVGAAGDRGNMGGSAVVTVTGDFDVPLRRDYVAPTQNSILITMVAVAVGLFAAPYLIGSMGLGVSASLLGLGALWAVILSGVVVSQVDLATMYVDYKVFGWAVIASWGLCAVAALVESNPHRLLAGVVIVLATAGMFEGLNFLFKLIRGVSGMGFGDTLILIVTGGVPAALTGSWSLGMYCVIGGLFTGIFAWLCTCVYGLTGQGVRVTRTTPFAFGPYLEIGWVLAWIWALQVGLPGVHG
jgi:prepilin signal peptidase PulO-like enzyme (type II secretory pathway)